jgi:hypothetical protein
MDLYITVFSTKFDKRLIVDFSHRNVPSQVSVEVTLQSRIRDVLGSNLDGDTGYQYGSWGIYIVRFQATTGVDVEDLNCATVWWFVECADYARLLQLFEITSYKSPINPLSKPSTVSSD